MQNEGSITLQKKQSDVRQLAPDLIFLFLFQVTVLKALDEELVVGIKNVS